MKRTQNDQRFSGRFKGLRRWVFVLAVAVVTISGSLAITGLLLTQNDGMGNAPTSVSSSGWGAEILDVIHDSALAQSLIAPANACGLGASSCFRCHNGNRAPEPPADPWHVDHGRVNNSCAGCHLGNPRLMREEMSHNNFVPDPRTTPDESCAGCHRNASEREGFLERYKTVQD